VPVEGTITAGVLAEMPGPVRDLEVRFRIRRPSGKLLFQRTTSRSDLPSGTAFVQYPKSIEGLDLREGRYVIEARVTADSLPVVELRDRVFIVKPGSQPVPVVLVPRVDAAPGFAPDGRFIVDPARSTRTRDRINGLVQLMNRQPRLSASLAIPPIVLDEWRRVQAGYETTGPAGSRRTAKDSPLANTYVATTRSLRSTLAKGRLELVDVPFAEPDMAGLQSIGGLPDLAAHYALSASIYQVSLAATPTAFTAISGDSISTVSAPYLVRQALRGVLLKPSSIVTTAPVTPSGVYALRGTPLRALVIDERAAQLLNTRAASPDQVLDRVLSRLTTDTVEGQPLVLPVALDTGRPDDTARLEAFVGLASASGWIRFMKATDAIRLSPSATADLRERPHPGPPAPAGYWSTVSEGRRYAEAFVAAAGDADTDADSAQYAALVSESRCWAGRDNRWTGAASGRAFATAASIRSRAVLSKITISSQSLTLSGSEGGVPLSIKNDSGKTLSVVVVGRGSYTSFPAGQRIKTTLRPSDNFLTVPVTLGGGAMSDRLTFTLSAATVPLASTVVELRASYLDRIVLVATVAIVLAGLLVYIRRKVRRAAADT
jgi:hypothetical protein